MGKLRAVVDIHNLWYSAHKEFDAMSKVDFKILKEELIEDCNEQEIQFIAYVRKSMIKKNETLIRALRHLGYDISEAISPAIQAAIDSVDSIEAFDSFSLVSGSGEFIPLLNYLKERDKCINVYAFPKTSNGDLFKYADNIKLLNKSHLYGATDLSE